MMLWSSAVLVLLGLSGPLWAQRPPTVSVNLDLSPEQRWEHLQEAFDTDLMKKAAQILISSQVPNWLHKATSPIVMSLEKHIPQPYAGEIRGIASVMKMNLADVVILNFAYEFTAYCTSIVAQDKNGNIYHGRNFDFPHAVLRNLTMNVVFFKNGEPAYFGTSLAGYVGLWTGMSPYKFTVSGNQRGIGATDSLYLGAATYAVFWGNVACDFAEELWIQHVWSNWWKNVVSAFFDHSFPVSWLIRVTLEEAKDFEDAVTRLSKTPLITGVYYIVGGVRAGEGVVISRDRKGPADIWPLEPLNGGWYRVQTNFDHWLRPPKKVNRRDVVMRKLDAVGQNRICMDKLYQVLSLSHVCLRTTIYTALMSAATPEEYTAVLRQKGCPKKTKRSRE